MVVLLVNSLTLSLFFEPFTVNEDGNVPQGLTTPRYDWIVLLMIARKIKGTEHLHRDVCHRKRVDLERLAEKDNLAKILFNVYHTRFSGYQWYCESLERLSDQDNLVNMFHFIKYFTGYQMLCVFRIIWHNKKYHITYFEKHEPFSIGKFLPLYVYYISKKIEQVNNTYWQYHANIHEILAAS